MKIAILVLIVAVALSAQTQPLAPNARAIYGQSAKRQVAEAMRKAPPNVLASREAVPTEDAASQIHGAVASAVFGKENLEKQRPFIPIRNGEFWVVYGSIPDKRAGGTAVTVIRASNGEVLRLMHEQ
jgi:hypothetical protein